MSTQNLISISVSDSGITVASPYNPDFPARARALGGIWDADSKTWKFDARDESRVRELCLRIYGTDGSPIATGDLVTLRVTCDPHRSLWQNKGPLFFAGREIGRASGRDSGGRTGDGIVFLEGAVTSGGSWKHWQTCTTEGAIFEIRDLPRVKAMEAIAKNKVGITLQIIEAEESPEDRRSALKAERAAILSRLAEIDTELEPEIGDERGR